MAWDILGVLPDIEQPLGELLPTGSLPEKRSKAIGMSSRITQEQTVRPPSARSDRQPLSADGQTASTGWSNHQRLEQSH
jgi:hypothetical protein